MSHRNRAVRVAALGMTVFLVAAGLALAHLTASTITIKLTKSGAGGTFSGHVKSARSKCRVGRKVSLHYKFNGAIADTVTNKRGRWSIVEGTLGSGYYTAKVAATKHCGAATSKQITFT